MIEPEKLCKLSECLGRLVQQVRSSNDYAIRYFVQEDYYLQKMEEIKELIHRFQEAKNRLELFEGAMHATYHEVFRAWQRDLRWLSVRSRKGHDFRTIL